MVVVTVAISRFGDGSQLMTAANLCLEAVEGSILQVRATLLKLLPMDLINIFIALIHPIQWTIALPVGATGPAKRQKKTSCI